MPFNGSNFSNQDDDLRPDWLKQTALDAESQRLKDTWGDIDAAWKERPEFGSILNESGQLGDGYKLNRQLDSRGLDAFRDRALSTGESPWAAMMKGQQEMQRQSAMESADAQAASGAAQARSSLASRGGLSGGAQLALARSGARDLMNSKQGINRQAMTNNMNVGIEDEKQRMAALQALPGMENQSFSTLLDKDKYNMTNTLQQISDKRTYDLDAWKKRMEVMAAGKQADATQNAGKK
jgi:hypothetical protein